MKFLYPGKLSPVAAICSTQQIYYRDLTVEIDESDNPDYSILYSIFLLDSILNALSALFLAVAFYIYYLVLPTRQIEDDCLLNFAGNLCLAHFTFLYDILDSEGIVPNMCITNLYAMYFFLLCGCAWYTLFMYCPWKKMKYNVTLEQSAILKQCRIVGYGAPALLIIFVNVHAHVNKLYSDYSFAMDCIDHQFLAEGLYVFAPITLTIAANCYFWKDLKKHIEIAGVTSTEDAFTKKRINSLLTLNGRLFLAFGLPILFFIIFNGAAEFYEFSFIYFLFDLADTAVNSAGIFSALILVMSRAGVWKCVLHKYPNFSWLQKWQPANDEDISAFTDNGTFEVSKTFSPV